MKNNINIKSLVLTALMTALVFAGSGIGIHTPSVTGGGYIHLGTAFLFLTAFMFGKKPAAFAGGVGMGLFDLVSGYYTAWAPFTLVISLLMGLAVGSIAYSPKKPVSLAKCSLAFLAAAAIKVVGYYITEVILYGNFVSPLASIPGNIVQVAAGAVTGTLLALSLKRNKAFVNYFLTSKNSSI